MSHQDRLGVRERLVGLSHLLGQGERIALDDVMHEVKEIWPTQARQALFG